MLKRYPKIKKDIEKRICQKHGHTLRFYKYQEPFNYAVPSGHIDHIPKHSYFICIHCNTVELRETHTRYQKPPVTGQEVRIGHLSVFESHLKHRCDVSKTSLEKSTQALHELNLYMETLANGASLMKNKNKNTPLLIQKSNFEQCKEINELVGNTQVSQALTEEDWLALKKQFTIIKLKFNKMTTSIEERNFEQLRDDVQDMLFTVYGMASRAGFPADIDFDAVCQSQYSKFDRTEEDALKTKNKYLQLGLETITKTKNLPDGRTFYITYSALDQYCLKLVFFPEGKWLKSIHFKEPNYKALC